MQSRMLLLGLALAAHSVCAPAQDSDPVQLDTLQVTAGRALQDSAAVPQAVTLVNREEIERQSPRVVTDLLRGQTGVFLQSSGPGQGVIIVRGLKGSELLHLVDGMRLNMTFFRNSPSQYIALVDPYNVERIEVLRGPASTLYGSDALGGVVQFLTPEHRFSGAGWNLNGGALAQYGSGELSRSARTWLAAGNESVSLSGGFTFTGAGGVDTGGSSRLPESQAGYVARGYDGKLLWAPAAGHELMFSGSFFEYPELPRFFEISVQPNNSPAGVPQRTEALFKPNDRRFLHARYRLTAALPFADSVELHLGQQVVNDDRSVVPLPPSRRELEQNRSTLNGFTAQALLALSEDLRLSYGGEFYSDQVDSAKQCQPLTGGCNTAATAPVFPDGARQDSAGIFVTAEWHAASRWLLDGGLRYSAVHTDLTATPLSVAQKLDVEDVTGHLGSALYLRDGLSWTANLARGFRAPNLFDLGTLGPRGGSPPQINVPNPNLDPETLEGVDSGFKWNQRGLRAELVAFYTEYHDRIESREPTGGTIPDGSFGCSTTPSGGTCPEVRSENISEARYWGWEAGAAWDATDNLNLSATLNFTRGVEQRAGSPETPANRVPPLNGRVGALWQHAAFSVEPFVLFAGEQRRLDADDQSDTRIAPGGTPGWATANLRLGWTPLPEWRLQLEGQNLLDADYREHGSGIDATGRSAVLTVALRFD